MNIEKTGILAKEWDRVVNTNDTVSLIFFFLLYSANDPHTSMGDRIQEEFKISSEVRNVFGFTTFKVGNMKC